MTKAILILTLSLLTFSLTKSANDVRLPEDVKKDESTSPPTITARTTEWQEIEEDEVIANIQQIISQCNESFRTDMASVEAMKQSGSIPDESDRTAKCFIRCVLEATGAASESGQYDPVRTATFNRAKPSWRQVDGVEEMATACSDRRESCKCERAYQYLKCIREMMLMRSEKGQLMM